MQREITKEYIEKLVKLSEEFEEQLKHEELDLKTRLDWEYFRGYIQALK